MSHKCSLPLNTTVGVKTENTPCRKESNADYTDTKHRELFRRITELTVELEELRSEKALFLESFQYAEDECVVHAENNTRLDIQTELFQDTEVLIRFGLFSSSKQLTFVSSKKQLDF